jgi:uncharacterized protein (UPF0548 family)
VALWLGEDAAVLRLDPDGVVIVDVFAKKTPATPATILATGLQRLHQYDQIARSEA